VHLILESDKTQQITNLLGSDRMYKDCISHSAARTLTYWASTNAYVSRNWIIVLFESSLPIEMSVLGSFQEICLKHVVTQEGWG